MKHRNRDARQSILSHLWEHLRVAYDFEWPRETFAAGQITDRDIDAVLAFKSDPELDGLRSALTRLESGTFGTCLRCKQQMRSALLASDPTRRVCPSCERALSSFGGTPVAEQRSVHEIFSLPQIPGKSSQEFY